MPDALMPLLVRFATGRIGQDADLPGYYDPDLSVWMVNTPDGPSPLVRHATDLSELITKTKITQESDDTLDANLQLMTKTMVHQESDDERTLPSELASLLTKTEVKNERDDKSK